MGYANKKRKFDDKQIIRHCKRVKTIGKEEIYNKKLINMNNKKNIYETYLRDNLLHDFSEIQTDNTTIYGYKILVDHSYVMSMFKNNNKIVYSCRYTDKTHYYISKHSHILPEIKDILLKIFSKDVFSIIRSYL